MQESFDLSDLVMPMTNIEAIVCKDQANQSHKSDKEKEELPSNILWDKDKVSEVPVITKH